MNDKIPLRFTIPVWGESYIDLFLRLSLKSMFTPDSINILKNNFYTELAIYSDIATKNYLESSKEFNEFILFFDNVIFENDFFEKSEHILDCFNIASPILAKSNHVLHQSIKHSLAQSFESGSYFILQLPELIYSKKYLISVLDDIKKGKSLILFYPLRIGLEESKVSYFSEVIEKNKYVDEDMIFDNIDNLRLYPDYFLTLKNGFPDSWKGFSYKFDNSKNIHIKSFYTISAAINPRKLGGNYNDLVECYAHDHWNATEKYINDVSVMSRLSNGCVVDIDIKNGDTDYREWNRKYRVTSNKLFMFMKMFAAIYPNRANAFFDYTYSIDVEKEKIDDELKLIDGYIKQFYLLKKYNKIFHKIRKYILKVIYHYLNKKFFNRLSYYKNKNIILVGDRKFILYIIKNISIFKEFDNLSISFLDYDNYYADKQKIYDIDIIKYDDLLKTSNSKAIYVFVNNETSDDFENKISLFKYNYEYKFFKTVLKVFKLYYVRDDLKWNNKSNKKLV